MANLSFKAWSEQEFAASAEAWQGLLARSDADPLFNSWHWQWRWWKHNAPALGGRLVLLAAYDTGGKLVGIAPFYEHRVRHKLLAADRLELLGRSWRVGESVFSEYLDLIAARDHASEFASEIAHLLWEQSGWGDLVMSNVRPESIAASMAEHLRGKGAYVRTADPLTAFVIALPATFDGYIKGLQSGTRRRLWNHRGKLDQPTIDVADESQVNEFLDVIDAFHQGRWGKPQYTGIARAFHHDFATEMARRSKLRLTLLRTGGATLSAMYNVRAGQTEYNVQSGFDLAASRGLSPGYLHFGYSIEAACTDGLHAFDMLGGTGQHRQYKGDLLGSPSTLVTFQAIRNPLLRPIYRMRDACRRS